MGATYSMQAGAPEGGSGPRSMVGVLLRYGALIVVDAFALLLIYLLAADGVWELAIFIAIVTLFVNVVNLREDLFPIRWMSPALALMALFVIYPIIYTVYVAFTNYGDGHLLTKQQAIERFQQDTFLPEDGETFGFSLYSNEAGEYALWLVDDAGNVQFATADSLTSIENPPVDAPETYEGFTRQQNVLLALQDIQTIEFGPEDRPISVSTARTAATLQQKYTYDAEQDAVIDNETDDVYQADDTIGQFVNEEGATLITGYRVTVGFSNFERFLTSPAISGPLLQIFAWTVVFALLSVFTTFVLGLSVALILRTDIPARRFFRTLLIVPYAIPGLIAVATWRGMLNSNFGVITQVLTDIFGSAPPFFTDPNWAKVGILIINLWLGYPYFMLVCSGALAAIPADMYEAAKVDGANALNQFFYLTLPMLLVAVGPLLIASFTYNFNNFVIIEAYNEGGPPIPGTPTPAGYTDVLISYAFRLAFGTGRGADFGLASAITIIIFIMVASVTLLQFRFTRRWEETSENV